MEGDSTPEMVASEDEENAPPMGNIADLTQMVSENAGTPGKAADLPASARVQVFTSKKNKGVSKGSSGSSGPPHPTGKLQVHFQGHHQKRVHLKMRIQDMMTMMKILVPHRPSR